MARYDDINAPAVAYATVLSCVVLFVIVFATQALTNYWTGKAEDKSLGASEYTASNQVVREQRDSISGYRWVNVPAAQENAPPEKKLQIPIDRAQEVVLEEMKSTGT